MRMYVIFDNKAEQIVGPVLTFHNDVVAIRTFTQIANNAESDLHKHPDDYELRYIGNIDPTNGVTNPELVSCLCTAAHCIKPQDNRQLNLLEQ